MDEKDKAEFVGMFSKVLDEHRGVNAETHERDHKYIDMCIKEKADRLIFWRGVRKQVFGWGIIITLSGIGLAVADYVQHILHIKN